MEQQIRRQVIRALIYADFFNYPLTDVELWQYAIGGKPSSQKDFFHELSSIKKLVKHTKGYYTLTGRENIVPLRKKREEIGKKKLQKAQKIAHILSYIPTIRCVGVSGSVAMKNAEQGDDIDLFFITEPNTVWISRLLVTLFLQILGARRKRGAFLVADTICANMFVDMNTLAFPKEKQNIYVAHEIAQMIPVINISYAYETFIQRNAWISQFLPNWKRVSVHSYRMVGLRKLLSKLVKIFEVLSRELQRKYMKKRQTTETILPSLIAFHPHDIQSQVLVSFRKSCKKYEV